ncbi:MULTISPECIES: hypothetical protein [unclassified Endozoicomonas]|uniref:hypothetical protein n=1 Tax=unclassified Endozoicomonas TaxID=2644528 RepID=UPI003BB6202D
MYNYLVVDVLPRISLRPARDIRELILRLWKEKFGANPLKADLDKQGWVCPLLERLRHPMPAKAQVVPACRAAGSVCRNTEVISDRSQDR